jgi:flagellar L-ring protein FlgH
MIQQNDNMPEAAIHSPPVCGRDWGWASRVTQPSFAHPAATRQQAAKSHCPSRERAGESCFQSSLVAVLCTLALPLTACMGSSGGAPDPAFSPVLAAPAPPPAANGAIFQASEGYAALTTGARAARVGDVVQVALVERTNASTANSQSTDRNGSIGLTPPTTGPLSILNPGDVAMGGGSEFSGRGAAAQSNQLTGDIAVTVVAVHANGLLEVRGEKRVRINRGDEYIRLSGLIRPADIGPDNRVASTRIANAQISYSGAGEVANASRQGWLQRFFSAVSPF